MVEVIECSYSKVLFDKMFWLGFFWTLNGCGKWAVETTRRLLPGRFELQS